MNHVDSCEPNCRMEKWYLCFRLKLRFELTGVRIVDNKPRMALFAGENGVETGEELTYDYNFKYEFPLNSIMTSIDIYRFSQLVLWSQSTGLPLRFRQLPRRYGQTNRRA